MPRSYWLPAIALGLTLASASARSPNQPRVSPPRPAVKEQPARATDTKAYPTENAPLPVRIIEGESDTKHTQAREAKSDQHDAEDLQTQKRAADAAEKQIFPAWLGAILTFFGTLLIVWSLREARRANVIAQNAIAQSERHASISLRAYLSVRPINISLAPVIKVDKGQILKATVDCILHNSGSTPASRILVGANIASIVWPPAKDSMKYGGALEDVSFGDIGQGAAEPRTFEKVLVVDYARLKSGQDRVVFVGKVSYRDVWGNEHTVTYEGSLVGVKPFIEVCETYQPNSGTLKGEWGVKFEAYVPDS
jgi:hypothetical protein